MNRPSTAEYQRHRKDTLTGIAHRKVLDTALDLARENQRRKKKRYPKAVMAALRAQ